MNPNHHLPSVHWSLWAKKTSEEIGSCQFSPLWMWPWGVNSWAHSSDLPTAGDGMPKVLAWRHWSGHQSLGASYQTTADGGLPSCHHPEGLAWSTQTTADGGLTSSHKPKDLAWSTHWTQKKKKWLKYKMSVYFLPALLPLETSTQHAEYLRDRAASTI